MKRSAEVLLCVHSVFYFTLFITQCLLRVCVVGCEMCFPGADMKDTQVTPSGGLVLSFLFIIYRFINVDFFIVIFNCLLL